MRDMRIAEEDREWMRDVDTAKRTLFAQAVGVKLCRDNATVHWAMQTICAGASVEEALGTAVKALAALNQRLLEDALAIQQNRVCNCVVRS